MDDATDWKKIALALAQRVNFAMTSLKGTGGMLDPETLKFTGWREYMAEGMEMIPGLKVDRQPQAETDESIAADAYGLACDEMERWQHERRKAGKKVGTTGSLCDGIAWLYGYIDDLEAKQPQAEAVQYTRADLDRAYSAGLVEGERLAIQQAEAVPEVRTIGDIASIVDAARKEPLEQIVSLCETIRYMVGIAERGSGGKCPDDMAPEVFLLRYVQRLEAALEFVARHKSSDWPERCQQMVDAARSAPTAPPRPAGVLCDVLGSEWAPCIKRPVVVHVRNQRPGEKHVSTREGITPVKPDDLIMRGVSGEEYPIGRAIFEQTYDFVDAAIAQQKGGGA